MIREGKPIMDVFIQPPVPIYMNFVFFNVKNPREVQYYGEKPILEEIGPYVYELVLSMIQVNNRYKVFIL